MKPLRSIKIEVIIGFRRNKATVITSSLQLHQKWDFILRNPDLSMDIPLAQLGIKKGKLYDKGKPWWRLW